MTSSGPRRVARLLALTLAPVLAPMPIAAAPLQTTSQDNDAARPSTGGLDGFSLTPRGATPQGTQTPVPTPPAPRIACARATAATSGWPAPKSIRP